MSEPFKEWLAHEARPDSMEAMRRLNAQLAPRPAARWAVAGFGAAALATMAFVFAFRPVIPADDAEMEIYVHEVGTPESSAIHIVINEVTP